MARRLLRGLRAPLCVGDTEILVRASIGVCTSDLAPDRETPLRDADVAIYQAKAPGMDRFEVFRPEFLARVVERLDLEHDLRLALERQEFVLFFRCHKYHGRHWRRNDRAPSSWPRHGRVALRRCRRDARQIAAPISPRTTMPPEAILKMLPMHRVGDEAVGIWFESPRGSAIDLEGSR